MGGDSSSLRGSHHYCLCDLNKPSEHHFAYPQIGSPCLGVQWAMPYDAQNVSAEYQPCTRLWVTGPSLTPGAQSLTRE